MRKTACAISFGVALCAPSEVLAQQISIRTLDLSSAAAHDTVTLKPGRYQFKVISLVPTQHKYVIAVSEGREVIEPIPLESAMGSADCPKLQAAKKGLEEEKKETEIPKRVTAANAALSAESTKSGCAPVASLVRDLVAGTDTFVPDVYDLGAGDYVIVDVARIEDGKASQRWERRYTTGSPATWRATYGYGFPFFVRVNAWNRLVRDGQQFYLKQVAESTYIVQYQRRTKEYDALPTVMFTYFPANERWWQPGWTVGLNTDITKPQVLTGPSLVLWSNLQLAFGAAFREEMVPIGIYDAIDDTVKTNLDAKQLQEPAFRVRPFISVTLRFNKNPFSKDGAGTGEQKKPETKPDTTKKDETNPKSSSD